MPYEKREELPKQVKDNLPPKAQDIFMSAFNDAWNRYKDPEERYGDSSREEVSMKVAWSAVKNKYEKNESGNWVQK